MNRIARAVAPVLAAFLALGCESLLPHQRTHLDSPWAEFDDALAAFHAIEVGETRQEDLAHLGIDPYRSDNVEILTYMDVFQKFVPNDGIRLDQQSVGVQDCIAARERCLGLQIEPFREYGREYGNFWSNFFRFREQTEIAGWVFESTVVMVDDVVVYKLWEGNPTVMKRQDKVKPLGPFQDIDIKMKLEFP